MELDDFNRGELKRRLSCLPLPLKHHIFTSLTATSLVEAHPSTACLAMSSLHPCPKMRNTSGCLEVLLPLSSETGSGYEQGKQLSGSLWG